MVYGFGGTGVSRERDEEDLLIFFENDKNRDLFFLMNYFQRAWQKTR
jgi:hypothetical protein